MSFVLRVDDRLSLRLIEPHHAEELFAVIVANRDHLAKWLPFASTTQTPDDTRAFAERALLGFAERKEAALSVLEDGKIIGGSWWTDWRQIQAGNLYFSSLEIGYWLAAEAQGRGVMTRCVHALLDHVFTERGIERVTIRCEPNNSRSAGVPRRLGFTHEGTLRHVCRFDGRWVDHYLFAMLAGDWSERRKKG